MPRFYSRKGWILLLHLIKTFVTSADIFLDALWMTLQLTAFSIFIALFIGLFFALLKVSGVQVFRLFANAYIALIRGTPLIVQIFILFYGIYEFLQLSPFLSAALGLAVHNGAYIAEIFRGAIEGVDRGQVEAGRSLGMSASLVMRRIVLPQASRRAIPPLGNQFIIGLKDSSLAAFIGMRELFGVAQLQGSNHFDYLTYYIIVAIYYLLIVALFTYLVHLLEKKLAKSD